MLGAYGAFIRTPSRNQTLSAVRVSPSDDGGDIAEDAITATSTESSVPFPGALLMDITPPNIRARFLMLLRPMPDEFLGLMETIGPSNPRPSSSTVIRTQRRSRSMAIVAEAAPEC